MTRDTLRTQLMDRFSALIAQLQQEGIPGDRYAETIAQSNIPHLLKHELGELRLLRNRCAHQGEPGNTPLGLAELESGLKRLEMAERQISALRSAGALQPRQEAIDPEERRLQRELFLRQKAEEERLEQLRQQEEERAFQEQLRQAAKSRATSSQEAASPSPKSNHARTILAGSSLMIALFSLIAGTPWLSLGLFVLAVIIWFLSTTRD